MAYWRDRSPQAGITVKHRHGRKLVGDRTAKSRLDEVRVFESQFADDVAVYATTREAFERATLELLHAASVWGLTISIPKTKGLIMGRHLTPTDMAPIQLDTGCIEIVQDFTYLGSMITTDEEVGKDVTSRISKASRAFGCLQRSVFQNRHLSTDTKRTVYRAAVLSVLLYGAETWAVKANSLRHLSGFHNRCIRSIMGVTRLRQWRERERITQDSWQQPLGWKKKLEISCWGTACAGLVTWHEWNLGGYQNSSSLVSWRRKTKSRSEEEMERYSDCRPQGSGHQRTRLVRPCSGQRGLESSLQGWPIDTT